MSFSDRGIRFIGWLALGCHLIVANGLPLAVPNIPGGRDVAGAAAKDRSRPFPCMDKPCGCATAEQCYASCCCHTPARRLAWAKAHRVEPAVLAALERRIARAAPLDLDAADVCRDYQSLAAEPAPPQEPPADAADRTASPRTVILRDMLACGGILSAWLACGATLPPPPRVAAPFPGACVGFLALTDVSRPSVSADLFVPPPRAA